MAKVQAGWYPAPDGAPLQVYWDGDQWTDHTQPMPDVFQQQMLAAVQATARHSATRSQVQWALLAFLLACVVLGAVVLALVS